MAAAASLAAPRPVPAAGQPGRPPTAAPVLRTARPGATFVAVYVAALTLDVRLGDVRSLKQKRSVVRPLVAELRRRYPGASVAETGHLDLHRRAEIGVAVLHCKDKPKSDEFPPDITRYWVGQHLKDIWVVYPWDAEDIDQHERNIQASKRLSESGPLA